MGEVVFLILIIFPTLIGMGELLHMLKTFIISPKLKCEKYIAVKLKENDALAQLNSVACELSWQGRVYGDGVIAVDCGLDSTQAEDCIKYCKRKGFFYCSEEDFKKLLK